MSNLIDTLFSNHRWYELVVELAVIWICVYFIFQFLKDTRGANIIKGVVMLFVLVTVGIRLISQGTDTFARLNLLYERFLGLFAILLIVVFQPELRQAMIRLGRARWFRASPAQVNNVVDAITDAATLLSKNQFGALIAIERSVRLGGLVEGGQPLDAEVSSRLLATIFWPNSPLHDLGVVIRNDRIVAAAVQFPLAEEGHLDSEYGSRHRAAAGLSLESDCVVVVVSEETGAIRIAETGQLDRVKRDDLRDELIRRLNMRTEPPKAPDAAPSDDAVVIDAERTPTSAASAPKRPSMKSRQPVTKEG